MIREGSLDFRLDILRNQIDELREILNAVCAASDGNKARSDILMISQCLDGLIVEYMNCINDNRNNA